MRGWFSIPPAFAIWLRRGKPFSYRVELLMGDAAVFGVLFDTFGKWELIVPDIFGGFAFGKENQIGVHSGIRIEHALRQADDSMDITLLKQFFLDCSFDTLTKKRTIRKHDARAAVGFE